MKRCISFQPNTLPGVNKLNKISLSKKWEKCIISISFSRENPSSAGNQVSGCCVHAFLLVSATPVTDTVVSLSAASCFSSSDLMSAHLASLIILLQTSCVKKMHLAFILVQISEMKWWSLWPGTYSGSQICHPSGSTPFLKPTFLIASTICWLAC